MNAGRLNRPHACDRFTGRAALTVHARGWDADLPGVPAAVAFESVLDQKLHEVASWTGLAAGAPSSSVTMPDPALRAALWTGAIRNPWATRAFADVAVVPSAPAGGAARPVATAPSVPDPLAAVPFPHRPVRVRPTVTIRIENMQQRLALAEFAEVGLPTDAREVSLDRLREAYRTLARIHHPDRHLDDSEYVRSRHQARFVRVTAAYNLLTETSVA